MEGGLRALRGDRRTVQLGGALGGPRPGEALEDPLAARRAEPRAEGRIGEDPAEGRGQRARVARGDGQTGLAVGARDLGDRAAGGGDQGVPVAMASAAGSEKPSYRDGTQATRAER